METRANDRIALRRLDMSLHSFARWRSLNRSAPRRETHLVMRRQISTEEHLSSEVVMRVGRRTEGRVILIAAMAVQVPSFLHSQLLPNNAACPKCQISSRTVVVLGVPDGPGSLENPNLVYLDPRGRFWVFDPETMPRIYEPNGKFIKEAGRPGQGPGELEAPSYLWNLSGDSVVVVDGGFRLHVFDPALRYVRSITTPVRAPSSTVVLNWPRNVVAAAFDRSPARVRFPLHAMDFSGQAPKAVQSFGHAQTAAGPDEMSLETRYRLIPARDGGYWAGKMRAYEITKWSHSHTEEFSLTRKPDWFQGPSNLSTGGPTKAPSPSLMGLFEDQRGLLWVFFFVPSPNWQDAYKRFPASALRGTGELPSNVVDWHLIFHTRIDVIDPKAKRLIISQTLPLQASSILRDGRVAVPTHTSDGVPTVRILQLSLVAYP